MCNDDLLVQNANINQQIRCSNGEVNGFVDIGNDMPVIILLYRTGLSNALLTDRLIQTKMCDGRV